MKKIVKITSIGVQPVYDITTKRTQKFVLDNKIIAHNCNSVMPALRGFLDEFSSNSIFIFTCNYPERIIAPLKSRLVQIEFGFSKDEKTPALIQMLKAACTILDTESVKYDKKTVSALVAKNFPDFRKTIGELQRYSSSGEIDSGILETLDTTGLDQLVTAMKAKDFGACRQWIATNQMDTSQFYRFFYNKVYPLMLPQSRPQLILHIGEAQFKAAFSIDLEINTAAFLVSVMRDCVFQ